MMNSTRTFTRSLLALQPRSYTTVGGKVIDTAKKTAAAAGEKIKEGGEKIVSMFKEEEGKDESNQRAAEHRGKAEEQWDEAKQSASEALGYGKSEMENKKQEAKEKLGEMNEKMNKKIEEEKYANDDDRERPQSEDWLDGMEHSKGKNKRDE